MSLYTDGVCHCTEKIVCVTVQMRWHVSQYRGDSKCHCTDETHAHMQYIRTLVSKPDVSPIMCTGQNTYVNA